jgi:hypothetical protein
MPACSLTVSSSSPRVPRALPQIIQSSKETSFRILSPSHLFYFSSPRRTESTGVASYLLHAPKRPPLFLRPFPQILATSVNIEFGREATVPSAVNLSKVVWRAGRGGLGYILCSACTAVMVACRLHGSQLRGWVCVCVLLQNKQQRARLLQERGPLSFNICVWREWAGCRCKQQACHCV